jgi:integrative and conjugative element protein (TIGR02256 family)
MLKHRQDSKRKREAGGLLVGRHLLNGIDMIVDGITAPLPGDRRTRFTFFRAAGKHQSALDLAWQVSEGTETYLGEWHTHPEPTPTPSPTDLKNWKRKLRADLYSDVLFFVIVGTDALCVWEGNAKGELNHLAIPSNNQVIVW